MLIKDVRLAFPDLFNPSQVKGQGDPSYRCTLLMERNSPAGRAVEAEIKRVASEKWPKEWERVLKSVAGVPNTMCWIDGDRRTYAGFAGNYALSATRRAKNGAPIVCDRAKRPLKDDGTIYAGCWVNASVNIWAQDNAHGRAIRCELVGVQFVRDDESFGGGTAPTVDAFEALEGGDADLF